MREVSWVVLFAAAICLTLAACRWDYFPGDVATAQVLQSLLPESMNWAQWITATAKYPWSLVLLATTALVSWMVANRRAALLALASFAGMWTMGMWLGPVVARPRPSPALVRVAGTLSGFSFPSVFALTYASTIGFLAVLFAVKTKGALRTTTLSLCCLILAVGWAARVALGAHWPSDVLLSYLLGLLWAALLVRFA